MISTAAQRAIASFSRSTVPSNLAGSLSRQTALQIARDRLNQPTFLPRRLFFSSSTLRMADSEKVAMENAAPPVKTAKQLKREAEKKAKLEKFKAKQAKTEGEQKQPKVRMSCVDLPCLVCS